MAIFDRFIRYEWAERALELVIQKQDHRELNAWLTCQGLGRESSRRTSNLLYLLWFNNDTLLKPLKDRALSIFSAIEPQEHIVLHWGMAINQFPLFRETVRTIGILCSLQNGFTKNEIVGRVIEKYSNQSTIKRAVERIIQTLVDWKVIQKGNIRVYLPEPILPIRSPILAEWFFGALLYGNSERYWLITDLLLAPEAFPFDLESHIDLLHRSPFIQIERDANGMEVVGIRG